MFTDDIHRKKYFDFKRGENKKNFMARTIWKTNISFLTLN